MASSSSISILGALNLRLAKEHLSPIVSLYDIGKLLFDLYKTKVYAGQTIQHLSRPTPVRTDIQRYTKKLVTLGIIEQHHDLPNNVFLLTSARYKDPDYLVCGLDPFCYLSHFSAMAYHGLTDRMPKIIFISTPEVKEWREKALKRMEKDLKEDLAAYKELDLPLLGHSSLKTIGKYTVNTYTSKRTGSYLSPKDTPIRVSSIGRTFLDMLRKSDLCGGMNHVIDIFENHAKTYLPLILDEIDSHGNAIEKVRAGYILETYCDITHHERVENWATQATRGGSRLLDPSVEYWSEFSEKWCISINVAR